MGWRIKQKEGKKKRRKIMTKKIEVGNIGVKKIKQKKTATYFM